MAGLKKGIVSTLALGAAMGWGQQALAQEANSDEVVVTASRVNAAGFNAPTPLAVLGTAEVQRTAPIQLSESLLQIPSFKVAGTSSTPALSANLRSLGANRTLLLVDGRRHVPTQGDGTVDLNLIPSALVQRTEVVTGGASASWGSDAVAGVVNIILDTKLQGLKGSIQAGQSRYGDAQNYSASLAGGTAFAGDKGHIVVGLEYATDSGIRDLAFPTFGEGRDWAAEERASVSSTAGVVYSRGVRRADNSSGGLITLGPLRGTTINPDGSLGQFGYGTVFGANMIGGTSNVGETTAPGGDLRYPFERYSVLAHAEYKLTETLTGFGELSYEHALGDGFTNALRFQGAVSGALPAGCTGATGTTGVFGAATGAISVNINNPFIPAALRTAMTNASQTCISVGRVFRELPLLQFNDGAPFVWRGVAGLKGDLGGGWNWDAYYQYGHTRSQQFRNGNINMSLFGKSIDAVRNTAGAIVCRVNADASTTNDDPGCVPTNIFGAGSITPQMAAYWTGTSYLVNQLKQQVGSANLRGEPFALWAGPVSIATGLEYRKEEISGRALGGFQTGNRVATPPGAIEAKEAYGEVVVPLVKDKPLFDDLSLNAAARYTNYVTSASDQGVTTWKVGATWDINDQVRLRATRSKDIRAGNLIELYTAASTALVGARDPLPGSPNSAPAVTTVTAGNPNLRPEQADTTTAGIVLRPSFLDGLSLSLDYYKIGITDSIGTIGLQNIIDRCVLQNNADACALITRTNGIITQVNIFQLNLNKVDTAGFDMEVAYRTPLDRLWKGAPGTLTARVLGNYVEKVATTVAVGNTVTDPVGQYNNPHYTIFTNLTYNIDKLTVGLDARWYQGGTIDNTLTPGLVGPTGINIGKVESTTYYFLSGSYQLNDQLELFGRVNNLLDEAPPFPNNGAGIFDEVGRAYRIGLRFKY